MYVKRTSAAKATNDWYKHPEAYRDCFVQVDLYGNPPASYHLHKRTTVRLSKAKHGLSHASVSTFKTGSTRHLCPLYSGQQLIMEKYLKRRVMLIIQQYKYQVSLNILHVRIHLNLSLPPQTMNYCIVSLSITTTIVHIETDIPVKTQQGPH
ncbi:Hypothetical_protein [Hexamita inflata]|uniref:Hypothetical_protein n=1 Tax=Hexamita inflata TaxID=28002 RepID=A0AA86PKP7_9EUKA|nr:Hypothetical protein HINF_LOCUS27868 [Hexamita inflata]